MDEPNVHQISSPEIPEGWQLVPIEPTTEMCLAEWNVSMSDAHSETGVSACAWAAMLAAAPQYVPEAPDGEQGLSTAPANYPTESKLDNADGVKVEGGGNA